MKIKQKFKQLELFDRIIIAIVLLVAVFAAYLLFRKSVMVTATIKVGESNILYEPWQAETGTRAWFSQLFSPGIKEQDGLGRIMAEVIEVYSYDTTPEKKAVYLTVKLNSVYNRASDQYTFKGTPLLIGSTVKLNLNDLFVEGLVTHIEGVKDPREDVRLLLETRIIREVDTYQETSGERDFIAAAINIGDQVQDNRGNPIITIIDKQVTDAQKTTTTSSGQPLLADDPQLKDIQLTLEVSAQRVGTNYFLFDDIPIKIGRSIPIHLPKISVSPVVTDITPL